MAWRGRRGESLIELIVALVVLELIGAAALGAALAAERIGRRGAAGGAEDAARWQAYRAVETDSACHAALRPDTIPLRFGATPERPALETVVRCGS